MHESQISVLQSIDTGFHQGLRTKRACYNGLKLECLRITVSSFCSSASNLKKRSPPFVLQLMASMSYDEVCAINIESTGLIGDTQVFNKLCGQVYSTVADLLEQQPSHSVVILEHFMRSVNALEASVMTMCNNTRAPAASPSVLIPSGPLGRDSSSIEFSPGPASIFETDAWISDSCQPFSQEYAWQSILAHERLLLSEQNEAQRSEVSSPFHEAEGIISAQKNLNIVQTDTNDGLRDFLEDFQKITAQVLDLSLQPEAVFCHFCKCGPFVPSVAKQLTKMYYAIAHPSAFNDIRGVLELVEENKLALGQDLTTGRGIMQAIQRNDIGLTTHYMVRRLLLLRLWDFRDGLSRLHFSNKPSRPKCKDWSLDDCEGKLTRVDSSILDEMVRVCFGTRESDPSEGAQERMQFQRDLKYLKGRLHEAANWARLRDHFDDGIVMLFPVSKPFSTCLPRNGFPTLLSCNC